MARMDILSLLIVIVLGFAVYGLSSVSGHSDQKSGGMGTTSEQSRMAFASYGLSQGEKVHYEWESNSNVTFVITTDPLHPQLAEFVNMTGLSGKGSFVSPAKATYYLQVIFLEIPPNSEASISYSTYRMTGFSELIINGKPVVLAILSMALAGQLTLGWKKRRTRIETEGRRGSSSFWDFFVADYKNWIAVVIGCVLLVSDSILISIGTNDLNHNYLIDWLGYLGGGVLFWGLVLGLYLSYGNYLQDYKVRKSQARSKL